MNYDHLLTRIYDVKEKTMLYQPTDYKFISNDCFLWDNELVYFTALGKDRYIPMLCSGFKEDNRLDGNLVYGFDIIKTHVGVYLLVKLKNGCWIAESLDQKYSVDLASLENRFSIKGNNFLNPELLTKEQNHE